MSTYVPKSFRDDVYRFFFTEGVVVCKKDRLGNWTGTLGGKSFSGPSIQVMQLMRSLKSRDLIKEQFAWRHYYWTLNDKGVQYMREYLHLAPDSVPNSHKATTSSYERVAEGRGRGGRGRGGRGGRGFAGRGFAGRGEERGRGGERGRGRIGRGRGRGRGFGG
uniref:40S ribosomal protein S10 n=1 Tax=Lygus hesperus TaxID=30085 RepID=A0A0A9WXG0_LYGHE